MQIPKVVFHGANQPFILKKGLIWAAIDYREAQGYGKFLYEFHLKLQEARIAILPFSTIKLNGERWLPHIAPINDFDIIYFMDVFDLSLWKKEHNYYHQVLINTDFIERMQLCQNTNISKSVEMKKGSI